MKKLILIDNYDSFTFNLYHYLSSLKINVDVIRNDKIDSKTILKNQNKFISLMLMSGQIELLKKIYLRLR